ncbi:hypothetical protein EV715DRAFT_260086 [Schizophyllum commune]
MQYLSLFIFVVTAAALPLQGEKPSAAVVTDMVAEYIASAYDFVAPSAASSIVPTLAAPSGASVVARQAPTATTSSVTSSSSVSARVLPSGTRVFIVGEANAADALLLASKGQIDYVYLDGALIPAKAFSRPHRRREPASPAPSVAAYQA